MKDNSDRQAMGGEGRPINKTAAPAAKPKYRRPRHPIFAALFDPMQRIAAAQLEPWRRRVCHPARGRVLELGAGTGLNFPFYDWGKIATLSAVEPDPYMAKRARRRARNLNLPVELIEVPAEALPFPEDTFDSITMTHVLCSVADPHQAVAELARVLKPDGTLRLFEHVRSEQPRRARGQDLVQPVWTFCCGGCHPNRDTAQILAGAGFVWQQKEVFSMTGAPVMVRPHLFGVASLQPTTDTIDH